MIGGRSDLVTYRNVSVEARRYHDDINLSVLNLNAAVDRATVHSFHIETALINNILENEQTIRISS